MKPVHALSIFLSGLAALGILLSPSLRAEAPVGQTQRLKSPDQTPEGLSPSDWASIRAAYETGRTEVEKTETPTSLTTNPIAQQAYLKASNTGAFDAFGGSVAVSGDTVVVGAPYEDSNATGVNGNQADNSVSFAGAAYVFTRSGTTWAQQAYLKANNAGANDLFGWSVAVSGDTVVVGAFQESSNATGVNGNGADNSANTAGAAYVFTRRGITWTQQAYLKASNTGEGDWFGRSVAVSGDTVVVGAYGEDSNATGVNGNPTDNSADSAGAAYIFTRSGTTWTQQAYLKASNPSASAGFGWSVAMSADTAVVGALYEDSAATGVNGNQADEFLATDSGAAYVFVRSGTTWTQQAFLKASNTGEGDWFGWSVAVWGETAVVGASREDSNATGVNGDEVDNSARNSGAAYVFTRSGTIWTQQAYLKASNTGEGDAFGGSVTVSGDTVVVGAYWEASNATEVNGNEVDNSARESGAAYVFARSGTTLTQQAYLKASNTGAFDGFGDSVAMSGDTVVIGASGEASSTIGVNGYEEDNSAGYAGAAYVFTGLASAASSAIARSGNDFLLSFPGEPGLRYHVQYTTSPDAPQVWNEFAPPAIYTAAPDGTVTHRDVNPPDPQRLYRAVDHP